MKLAVLPKMNLKGDVSSVKVKNPASSDFLRILSDRNSFPGVGWFSYLTEKSGFFYHSPNEDYYSLSFLIRKLCLSPMRTYT
ncbi:hypothetical protein ACMV5I_28480 [Serratia sp. T13T92]|uniref:hypothetical protein n=1 Tax=Serratia sp. T13T92 TaxID=3397496 RepID=UPI0039DFCA48